jgi:ribosomal protein S19
MRSKWKGIMLYGKNLKKSMNYIKLRSKYIKNDLLGKRISVYNGIIYTSFVVRKEMLGHKYGEFSITKKLGSMIHEKKGKKKKK